MASETLQNFLMGDILVLFSSKTDSYSAYGGGCSISDDNRVAGFNTKLNSDPNSPSFRVKEFNGDLTAQLVKDLDNPDLEKKIRVLAAFTQEPNYQESPGTGFFLTQCWSDQQCPSNLDSNWASSLAGALTAGAGKVSDLNKRAAKTLISGSTARSSGSLIFSCRGFAVGVMKRLYGLNKVMNFPYLLDSYIGVTANITTTAKGEQSIHVTYTDKSAGSSAEHNVCVKGVIYINDITGFEVVINNAVTQADLAALNAQFALLGGNIAATSSAWNTAVDNFVTQVENYNQNGGRPPPGFTFTESPSGGGLFKIMITPKNSISGAVFSVHAGFSIGTNANGSFAMKFEGFRIEFDPNRAAYERELIKQLRARYREAMENYIRAVNAYVETITTPGGPIVPANPSAPDPSPPPTNPLPPPETIIVPPPGEGPTRETIPEPAIPNTDVTGATGEAGGVIIENSGSDTRIIDSTDSSAFVTD
jgi:hypothetical protein